MRTCRIAALVALIGPGLWGAAAQSASSAPSAQSRQLTDIAGRTVTMPSTVTRVADPWHANNGMVLMMGAAGKIVATTRQAKRQPWFRKLFPSIEAVPAAFVRCCGSTASLSPAHIEGPRGAEGVARDWVNWAELVIAEGRGSSAYGDS